MKSFGLSWKLESRRKPADSVLPRKWPLKLCVLLVCVWFVKRTPWSCSMRRWSWSASGWWSRGRMIWVVRWRHLKFYRHLRESNLLSRAKPSVNGPSGLSVIFSSRSAVVLPHHTPRSALHSLLIEAQFYDGRLNRALMSFIYSFLQSTVL